MKAKYFNVLLLPMLCLLLAGAGNLYWYSKFDARIPVQQAKLAKLQSAIQLLDCQALNKGAILSIAQGNFEDGKSFAEILFYEGLGFIFIGIVSFASIFRYLKKN